MATFEVSAPTIVRPGRLEGFGKQAAVQGLEP
jgi:hypothetical protein